MYKSLTFTRLLVKEGQGMPQELPYFPDNGKEAPKGY